MRVFLLFVGSSLLVVSVVSVGFSILDQKNNNEMPRLLFANSTSRSSAITLKLGKIGPRASRCCTYENFDVSHSAGREVFSAIMGQRRPPQKTANATILTSSNSDPSNIIYAAVSSTDCTISSRLRRKNEPAANRVFGLYL
jgi:hypothetical protein